MTSHHPRRGAPSTPGLPLRSREVRRDRRRSGITAHDWKTVGHAPWPSLCRRAAAIYLSLPQPRSRYWVACAPSTLNFAGSAARASSTTGLIHPATSLAVCWHCHPGLVRVSPPGLSGTRSTDSLPGGDGRAPAVPCSSMLNHRGVRHDPDVGRADVVLAARRRRTAARARSRCPPSWPVAPVEVPGWSIPPCSVSPGLSCYTIFLRDHPGARSGRAGRTLACGA